MQLSDYRAVRYWPEAQTRLAPGTLSSYDRVWRRLIEPVWGSWDLAAIEPANVEGWLRTLSPGNRPKARTCLGAILGLAVRDGLIPRDPCKGLEATATRLKQPRTLTLAQTKELLRGFYGHELEAWLICSVGLALRREESCALRWADIDLRSGATSIERTLQWVDGAMLFGPTKTPKSTRVIPLPRSLTQRLREIRGRGYLTSGTDVPLSPDAVRKRYERHCRSHGLPYVPARNLRHSWATNAIEAGADPMAVAMFLGHSDMNTCYRYYLTPRLRIFQDAQKVWDKRLLAA